MVHLGQVRWVPDHMSRSAPVLRIGTLASRFWPDPFAPALLRAFLALTEAAGNRRTSMRATDKPFQRLQ
jgi:hypothetical protein